MNDSRAGRVTGRQVIGFAGIGLVGACSLALALWIRWHAPTHAAAERLLFGARSALQRGQYQRAEELASGIDSADECWAAGRLVAGEAAQRDGRIADALREYRSVPRDGTQTAVLAAFSTAELSRDIGRLTDAEREYLYVLDHQPENTEARARMAFLLGVTGRRWESLPHFMFLLRRDAATLEEIVLLGDLERPIEQGGYLRRCAEQVPDDILVRLGLAADAMNEGHSTEARRLLQDVVDRAPHYVAAQAMLGEMLVDADDATFIQWHASLPPAAEGYADTWFVRGLWARRRGSLRVAARCFWETVRIAPNHRRGNYQLGQVLVALGETPGGEFAERASALFELTQSLDHVLRTEGRHEPTFRRITQLMEGTGRMWEACGWAAKASQSFSSASWPQTTFVRLSALLTRDSPQTLDSANLAVKYDLSGFPNHLELLRQIDPRKTHAAAAPVRSSIRFEEAVDAGIDFVYCNGDDPTTKGRRMFEQTGGGVAVLDFDGDGWPDLFFSQGAEWRHGSTSPTISSEVTDRVYRNVGGDVFVDATRETGLVDHGFGQGCAAGDFDDDGFPDLYVANIGRNRLHRNNGDGTFSDATNGWSREEDTWTASCIIVDVNADGLPDLFDVTYVTGPHVYEAICDGHGCSPKVFQGIPDRLYLNRGDGTFELVPHATPDSNSSKGLGAVAVDLGVCRRPCLFIANDQVPNFLLRNFPSQDRFNVRLEDEGFSSGLAFNGDGLAMASMGIAADDVNGDGRIDFFVTNFKDESKVLYLQDAAGLFVDATNAAGLRAAGMEFVGWGTQFLDADCDGEPDLVVANGHVDDYRDAGGEYHMRPQFFRNTGGGRFVELAAPDVGSFFERKYLGRGLARLDWNRDGRMDFVVSNIGARAALVTNLSTGVGHFLNVRLHARATARDAVGSVVDVATGSRRWSKQLVAGDGYMASNERLLQFGLGDADSVNELQVIWPSGATTTIPSLPVDVTVELVEGQPRGILWHGSEPAALPVEGASAVPGWSEQKAGGPTVP